MLGIKQFTLYYDISEAISSELLAIPASGHTSHPMFLAKAVTTEMADSGGRSLIRQGNRQFHS
jgi:hypothetical protein